MPPVCRVVTMHPVQWDGTLDKKSAGEGRYVLDLVKDPSAISKQASSHSDTKPKEEDVPSPPKQDPVHEDVSDHHTTRSNKADNTFKRQTSTKMVRRSIFGHYMDGRGAAKKRNDDEDTAVDMQSPARATPTSAPPLDVDIRQFTPKEGPRKSLRAHFSPIDDYDGVIPTAHELPPLPAPLVRHASERFQSGGVYPMTTPKSILRKGKFSCPTETSSSHETRHAHFDPRIVVTEFPDSERSWFSDEELNKFKHDTLMLAHHYMALHPEVAGEFQRQSVDPVTGKLRSKALFCLPGLCSEDGTDAVGVGPEFERMLKTAVQKVLIVDPNKAILDLFCKSIQAMFPSAKILTAQTGEDALRLHTADMGRQGHWITENGGFDIVIVEEKLNRHRDKGPSMSLRPDGLTDSRSSSQLNKKGLSPSRKTNGMPKHDSLSKFENMSPYASGRRTTMSGSQLIRRICQLEEQWYGVPTGGRSDETSLFCSPQRRSLLIGVSMDVEGDREVLMNSGADIVWGKPPPTMGDALRNQLISALISKRQRASLGVLAPSTEKS